MHQFSSIIIQLLVDGLHLAFSYPKNLYTTRYPFNIIQTYLTKRNKREGIDRKFRIPFHQHFNRNIPHFGSCNLHSIQQAAIFNTRMLLLNTIHRLLSLTSTIQVHPSSPCLMFPVQPTWWQMLSQRERLHKGLVLSLRVKFQILFSDKSTSWVSS